MHFHICIASFYSKISDVESWCFSFIKLLFIKSGLLPNWRQKIWKQGYRTKFRVLLLWHHNFSLTQDLFLKQFYIRKTWIFKVRNNFQYLLTLGESADCLKEFLKISNLQSRRRRRICYSWKERKRCETLFALWNDQI